MHIHLLDDAVINKIAAGEVVERPASVVKELVENALDAKASSIRIELEDGGKKLIRVSDNGLGMSPEDCWLAIKRHATSKIQASEDLFSISTMGFRGEALASIASVSRFTLISREQTAKEGSRLSSDGGENWEQSSWEGVAGTQITVAELFFNVPVRAKFLKAFNAEYSQILELVEALALTHPQVSLRLSHNGKETFSAPGLAHISQVAPKVFGESLLRERASQILSADHVRELLYTFEDNQYGSYEALISPPGLDRGNSRHVLSFVNQRWVKDKTLQYGVLRGYHSHLLKGRYPEVIGFLNCDPSLVDVNVHPAKFEIRFQYTAEVQGLISTAIRKVLRDGAWAAPVTRVLSVDRLQDSSDSADISENRGIQNRSEGRSENRSDSETSYASATSAYEAPRRSTGMAFHSFTPTYSGLGAQRSTLRDAQREAHTPKLPFEHETKLSSLEGDMWSELNFIGSFAKCYLMFEREDQLLCVDQHAFHERILFECLQTQGTFNTQERLMIPEEINLSIQAIEALKEHTTEIAACGFDVLFCSVDSLELRAVPSVMRARDLQSFFLELSRNYQEGHNLDAKEMTHQLLSTIACHSAVRAGEHLSENEVKALIQQAHSVDFFHNCPHGRRVFKWFKRQEVESWFDRS